MHGIPSPSSIMLRSWKPPLTDEEKAAKKEASKKRKKKAKSEEGAEEFLAFFFAETCMLAENRFKQFLAYCNSTQGWKEAQA